MTNILENTYDSGPIWDNFSIHNRTDSDFQVAFGQYGDQQQFFNFLTGCCQFDSFWNPIPSGNMLVLDVPAQTFMPVVNGPIFDLNTDLLKWFTSSGSETPVYVNFGLSYNGIPLNPPPLCFTCIDGDTCKTVYAGFGRTNGDRLNLSAAGTPNVMIETAGGAKRGTYFAKDVFYAFNIIIRDP